MWYLHAVCCIHIGNICFSPQFIAARVRVSRFTTIRRGNLSKHWIPLESAKDQKADIDAGHDENDVDGRTKGDRGSTNHFDHAAVAGNILYI